MIRTGLLAAGAGLLVAAGAHAAPNVTVRTTVNLSVGNPQQQTCGTAEWIAVAPGTEVSLCYEIENTGDVEFTRHDVVDSVIGSVLDDFPFTVGPGGRGFLTKYHTPFQTTVYTATWTARDPVGMLSASDVDSAFVLVPAPGPAASGLAALASLALVAGRRRAPGR